MTVMVHVLQCCRNSRAGLRAGSSAVGGTIAISDSWSSGGFWGSRTMVLGMRWMKGMTGGGEGVSSTTGRRCDMEKERNWMDRNTTPSLESCYHATSGVGMYPRSSASQSSASGSCERIWTQTESYGSKYGAV
jgi:hypothetical protein